MAKTCKVRSTTACLHLFRTRDIGLGNATEVQGAVSLSVGISLRDARQLGLTRLREELQRTDQVDFSVRPRQSRTTRCGEKPESRETSCKPDSIKGTQKPRFRSHVTVVESVLPAQPPKQSGFNAALCPRGSKFVNVGSLALRRLGYPAQRASFRDKFVPNASERQTLLGGIEGQMLSTAG
jgi:hypothetical protein